MKNITFLICLMCYISNISAQKTIDTIEWCPKGATWIYGTISKSSKIFIKFRYTKDTLISNKNCKKIESSLIRAYNNPFDMGPFEHIGFEYFSNQNDSIYYLVKDSFYFIYSFDFKKGEKYEVCNPNSICKSNPNLKKSDTLKIEIVAFDTIGDKIYKYFIPSNNNTYTIGKVYNHIGSIITPFPQINGNGSYCPPEGPNMDNYGYIDGLSCYRDDLRGDVNFAPAYSYIGGCHYFSGIENFDFATKIINQNNNLLEVNSNLNYLDFKIINLNGQIISKGIIENNQISIESFNSGVYFIQLRTQDKTQTNFYKFFKLN